MTPRRAALAALLLLATFALYFLNRGSVSPLPSPPVAGSREANAPSGNAGAGDKKPVRGAGGTSPNSATTEGVAPFNPAEFPIAARLNAADSNIQRDLEIVSQVFEAWRTNFPREGNPVGENAEITRALTGANRLEFALIPPKHPSINSAGELCDRWGTPFRFHQISGEEMEIRSAGPDRRFANEDDALWIPGAGGFQKTP
ncbi:MAG: hypothetical protein ACKOTE_15145 [Opitutaceae bacterium]